MAQLGWGPVPPASALVGTRSRAQVLKFSSQQSVSPAAEHRITRCGAAAQSAPVAALTGAGSVEQQPSVPLPGSAARAASALIPAADASAAPRLPVQHVPDAQEPTALPPVALVTASMLPPQTSLAAAVQQLRAAVLELPEDAGAYASGLVRLEVPLPQGTKALWWLRGQPTAAEDAISLLHPRIYFSPRRTTAADTEGSAAAGAATAGAASVAGAGAAWLWRGQPGQPLGDGVVRDMQRFLAGAAACPRIRAFGGARFNAAQLPAEEWSEFGSYCFLIPRLEFLEASGCCILACTVAWDAHAAPGGTSDPSSSTTTTSASSSVGVSFTSVEAAAMDAVAALDAVQPPGVGAAGVFKLERLGSRHVPDEAGWQQLMDGTHAELAAGAAAVAAARQHADKEQQNQQADNGTVSLSSVDACTPMLKLCPEAAREEYLLNGQEGLDDLLAALDGGFEATTSPQDGGLTKVVLARRTDVSIKGRLDPLALLEALQERDPRAYQIMLQMPSGASFLGSTPECLYTRTGTAVASEAVAGTRARGAGGDVERDFWLAFDLLRSHKDHVEFTVVRDWVQQALSGVCEQVQVDVAKSVLKQGAVQHLYGKLSAQLKAGCTDAHLLAALHPTPAVCGRPREDALGLLASTEPFDRGYYAGPFGWISQGAAEFVVAIRSALVQPAAEGTSALASSPWGAPATAAATESLEQRRASHAAAGPGPQSSIAAGSTVGSSNGNSNVSGGLLAADNAGSGTTSASTLVSLYAGVGIVRGSDTAQEWAELDLKVRQYERLLQSVPPLAAAPNINALWARLLVEELCRLGCNTFCVAPGSRSSPLTVAVAQHPRARIVPCIDERSLGFWALGYGRATGRPAVVITSSGTAVANLLPAAVEASQSGVPLLLLTGDRPAELRDTGANQTIDQVKLFGGYARWHADLPAPVDAVPARLVLSTVDTAVQRATGLPAGPVHLNCQFREPLAPVEVGDWDRRCLQGLQHWEASDAPFTAVAALQPSAAQLGASPLQLPALLGLAAGGTASSLAAAAAASLAADPAAASALQAIVGAGRGLIVAAELTRPEDVVAAAQLGQLLGWPVAADVLSGLRAGVPALPGKPIGSGPCHLAVVHHFDHLLLGDRQSWEALRPDVVLQLGGHLTSKRINQFLEWCCTTTPATSSSSSSSGSSGVMQGQKSQPLRWILADRSPKRHDQFHLLTHRLQAPLPVLAAALAAQLAASGSSATAAAAAGLSANGRSGSASTQELVQQQRRWQQRQYCRLLQLLNAEAAAAVDAALARMPEMTEPQVARTLAQQLPPGEGLFVGNSMPIRDLDMYACPAPAHLQPLSAPGMTGSLSGGSPGAGMPPVVPQQGVVAVALGAPVAANRGASGIDGVLSTAAGFADGLGRGSTLVVGDLSFLHDINGLNLLRSGESRPPLTVVLINNSGGGIFSFLPIAEALPEDVFTPLWATPQHVDLEGMCRAHGIPHQKVTALQDLHTALRSAWSCNRHSVIEVVTSRTTNLDRHREIQAEVRCAVSSALRLLERQPQGLGLDVAGGGPPAAGRCLPYELAVQSASYHAYRLPLAKTLTTVAKAGEQLHRHGFLLRISLAGPGSSQLVHGVGEVATLPGLHAESLQQAEQQLALLCQLLGGGSSNFDSHSSSSSSSSKTSSGSASCAVTLPFTVALLGGRLADWLQKGLGVEPESLLPSVRCGLEAALLSALAQYQGIPMSQLLASCQDATAPSVAQSQHSIAVNGLLDCQGSPAEAAAEAAALLERQPYAALKVKVGRRDDPMEDAAAVLAIRQAVGPTVVLRADANRRWKLEQAVQFATAAAGAELQYVEEPLGCTADLPELYYRTGLRLALDESVDEGLVGPWADSSDALCDGVVALVLKPAVLGGFERTAKLAAWAQHRGMHAVVSSSFETSLGIAHLSQLAAALDEQAAKLGIDSSGNAHRGTHHGLATLSWFAEDLFPAAGHSLLQLHAVISDDESRKCGSAGDSSGPAGTICDSSAGSRMGEGMCIPLAAAEAAVSSCVMLALGLDRQQGVELQLAGNEEQQQRQGLDLQQSQETQHIGNGTASMAAPILAPQRAQRRRCAVSTNSGSYDLSLLEVVPAADSSRSEPPVLLLHGFLGGAEDWLPLMHAMGLQRRCMAVDLPGHGSTTVTTTTLGTASSNGTSSSDASSNGVSNRTAAANGAPVHACHAAPVTAASAAATTGAAAPGAPYRLEAAAEAVAALVEREGLQGCVLVGYSLGARVALLLAARWPHLFRGIASISGTPGLPDSAARAERAARDDALAAALRQGGLERFLSDWYQQPMWAQLRASPRFQAMLQQRVHRGDSRQLAATLSAASPGRSPSLWQELPLVAAEGRLPPLLLVAGQEDAKFVGVAESLAAKLASPGSQGAVQAPVEVVMVPGSGHAVHIERPVALLAVLDQFCVGASRPPG